MIAAGALYLAGRDWLLPAGIGLGLALIFIGWTYARTPAPHGLRIACAGLKLLGVAALLACLVEPMWSDQRAKPGANVVAIVADNSASMTLRGSDETLSRGEALQQLIAAGEKTWRKELALNFTVQNYLADARLRATHSFQELTFDGRVSALGGSLKSLADQYRGQPLAGIFLLSDGIAPDLEKIEIAGLPPVYPVIFGSERPVRDLAIAETAVSQTAFEDAPVTVTADVTAVGFPGEEVVGTLSLIDPAAPDAETKAGGEQTVRIPRDSQKVVLRFQLRPDKTGVLFYRLQLAPKSAGKEEATTANNERIITVDRGGGTHRVLYVSGRPNWEYKFLQRAITADAQTQLVALIRIAKREPKFEFRGRVGESSNPLFRGFGNQAKDEIERYDQPVLVRLNTEDEIELRDGFPKRAEELFRYRALIVDDLEAEFFTPDQMTMIQRFVSERGGGFLMLGGADSLAEGKFARTPIGDVLPVYVDRVSEPPREALFEFSLTREGWLEPWARLRPSETEERARLDEQPAVEVLNRVRGVKPAAQVVATVNDGMTDFPAIVTQRFGRGRAAAVCVGDLWHTGLGDEALQKDLGKAWRQLVRWLVADVPNAVELRAETGEDAQSVRLQVRVRNARFEPLDNATVSLEVQPVSATQPVTLTAEASSSEAGLYEASYVPRDSGGYLVQAAAADENGVSVGSAATGWTTDLAGAEFRSLVPNRALMENLARKTGGEVLAAERLEQFARELPSKRAPVTEVWTRPIWHTPWMFLFALGCFVGEWGLRRWKGLA